MSVILFFFIYTTALLVICIMALSVCGAAFLVSHSRRYILRSLFFVFYALELSWIFGAEWMAQHVITIDDHRTYEPTTAGHWMAERAPDVVATFVRGLLARGPAGAPVRPA